MVQVLGSRVVQGLVPCVGQVDSLVGRRSEEYNRALLVAMGFTHTQETQGIRVVQQIEEGIRAFAFFVPFLLSFFFFLLWVDYREAHL